MWQCKQTPWDRKTQYPKNGMVGKDVVCEASITWPTHPGLTLRLDPSRNSERRSKNVSAEVISDAAHPKATKSLWNTPRWGKTDGCKTLTVRSERDLPTTVYFEKGTPACATGVLNPDWVDWLQGFPTGYSDPDATIDAPPPATQQHPRKYTCFDVFSGIGGIARGLHPWCTSVGYCDVDPHARSVIAARQRDGSLDTAPIFDDIQTLTHESFMAATGLNRCDMLAGGFPCVGISQAGHKEGLNNVKSSLFHHMVRLIDELDVNAVFLENVSNITSGKMYGALTVVLRSLTERGFECRYVSLRATNVGAPQTRNRWFLLATRNGLGFDDFCATPLSHDAIVSRFFPHWESESNVPRQVDAVDLTKAANVARKSRLQRLGNTVVPQMVTAAFETMVAGRPSPLVPAGQPKRRRLC